MLRSRGRRLRGLLGAFAAAGLLACTPNNQGSVLRLFPEGTAEDHAVCASVLVITTAIAREDADVFDAQAKELLSDSRIAAAGASVLDGSPDHERSVAIGARVLNTPNTDIVPFAIYAQPVCSERYPEFFAALGLRPQFARRPG